MSSPRVGAGRQRRSLGQGWESAGARVSGTMDAAAAAALASASAGQSNPSAGVFQVCPPPLLPNAVSFDSMRGSIRGFPWIDGLGVRGPVQSLRRRRPGLSNRGSGHGEQSIFQVLLPTAMVADSLIGTRHTRRCGRSSALTSPPPPVSLMLGCGNSHTSPFSCGNSRTSPFSCTLLSYYYYF
jgi:hypothetical protein